MQPHKDFVPFLSQYIHCAFCQTPVLRKEAAIHTYYRDYSQVQEYFCPDKLVVKQSCHLAWEANQ